MHNWEIHKTTFQIRINMVCVNHNVVLRGELFNDLQINLIYNLGAVLGHQHHIKYAIYN